MPYMMLLTRDGVAIHGSTVREGWATHVCIGVPLAFARLIFSIAERATSFQSSEFKPNFTPG
jgi:hypothetical protein